MSGWPLAGLVLLCAGLVRQAFVLSAVVRSHRFLRAGPPVSPEGVARDGQPPRFFIVLPVLREAARIREAVAHLGALARGHTAQVVLVTTAREAAEARRPDHGGDTADGDTAGDDTIALARARASQGKCAHLHYPDACGLKGDQINYAAAVCAATLPGGVPTSDAFLVCYDADSRPPPGALASFTALIAGNPAVDVFHHSFRFEYPRPPGAGQGLRARLRRAACDAAALRANRFVLGFEIPRLANRSPRASRIKRAACSGVYAHVTGQGLCIRLSLLERLPLPARSPLEDMHYSFILGSRGVPVVAVPVLGETEGPASVAGQLRQAARWFFGPARFVRYLNDPATRRGWRAALMAASAFGSAAEWLGCAVVPALVLALIAAGSGPVRAAAAAFAVVCAAQVVLTEVWLGSRAPLPVRVARTLAFPVACTVHGVGGILGAARLLTGGTGAGKTERETPPPGPLDNTRRDRPRAPGPA